VTWLFESITPKKKVEMMVCGAQFSAKLENTGKQSTCLEQTEFL
jgi:hypothetical protein